MPRINFTHVGHSHSHLVFVLETYYYVNYLSNDDVFI